MLKCFCFTILIFNSLQGFSQAKTISEIKSELEKSPNPPLYVKDLMKKKFKLDTVVVMRTRNFNSLADSLAYKGVIKKVYGPYTIQGQKFLVQILARLPNTFYRISQIFIDSSVFRHRVADSIGKSIISRIKNNQDSFEHLSQIYSMSGESASGGDLGWVARGSVLQAIQKPLDKAKKGDVFSVWTENGLHIIQLTEGPKQDNGVALMMRIFL